MLEIASYIIVGRNKDQKEVKIDLAYLHGSEFFGVDVKSKLSGSSEQNIFIKVFT